MLKNSHDKVKQLIYLYFYVFEMQYIPTVRFKFINNGRLLILPLILAFSAFCNIWHFAYQVKSLDNVLDIAVNTNLLIAGVQIIFTVLVVNIGLKRYHLQVQRYFENIVESAEDFISDARKTHLSKSLEIANTVARGFSIAFIVTCQLYPAVGLYQTNYVSPFYYRIPGISSTSLFFYPVNILGQYYIYWHILFSFVAMDSLFLIYLFYFRGEIYSINAVSQMLSNQENLGSKCKVILRRIYLDHRELLEEFTSFSKVLWHFYCYRFLAVILLMCSSSFSYSRSNSFASGVVLQTLAISLLVILCVPGQLIDNCSVNLQETLYESLWYEMSLKDQRNFLLIFKGAQRNIKAETMAIDKISFSTSLQGIKTAISYAAFVYTVLL
ncbi:hypothetical protein DMENIID0001_054580 [Sergentomyia squamirostris]